MPLRPPLNKFVILENRDRSAAGSPGGPPGKPPTGPKKTSKVGPVGLIQQSIRTTTGNQTFKLKGFGRPVAARFILANVATNGDRVIHALASHGATDGSNQWCIAAKSQDAVGTSNTSRRGHVDEVAVVITGGATNGNDVEINFVKWVKDGVQVNVGVNAGGAVYLMTVILYGGPIEAVAGTYKPAVEDVAITETIGFQLDALYTASTTGDMDDGNDDLAIMTTGLASFDGSTIRQCCFLYRSNDASANMVTQGDVRSAGINSANDDRFHELGNITATTFDVTPKGDAGAWETGYLALKLGPGGEAWAGVLDSPTSTGENAWTGVGFTPTSGTIVPSMIASVDTSHTAGEASGWGIYDVTVLQEAMCAWADEDGPTTSNTQSLVNNKLDLDADDGTNAFVATLTSFYADVATLNFTVVDSTIRKWPALFLRV